MHNTASDSQVEPGMSTLLIKPIDGTNYREFCDDLHKKVVDAIAVPSELIPVNKLSMHDYDLVGQTKSLL